MLHRPTPPSCVSQPASIPVEIVGPSSDVSFGTPDKETMSIAASQGGLESSGDDDSAVLPPSGAPALSKSDPKLTAMLSRAAASIGLEWNPPPCPEHSRLDDWFLGAASPPQILFFPEVHEEVTRSWKSPLSSRECSATSSTFSALDGAAAKGYSGVPPVECSVAKQMCPQSASCGNPKNRERWLWKLSRLLDGTRQWNLFITWCSSHREDPIKCPISVVLSFLQDGLERRLSPSTLKVYVAAIAAHLLHPYVTQLKVMQQCFA
ncbi:hypothetical protein PO909_001274 [Leuciscus waleckii]